MEIKRIYIKFCEVIIETDKGNISCVIDDYQRCCEDYGVTLTILNGKCFEVAERQVPYDIRNECGESELKNYIGKKIKNINFHSSTYSPCLVIKFDNESDIHIEPFNYKDEYPHDYIIKYPGFEEELEIGKNPPDINKVIEKLGSL